MDMVSSAINSGAGGFTSVGTALLGIGEIETLRSVRVSDTNGAGSPDAAALLTHGSLGSHLKAGREVEDVPRVLREATATRLALTSDDF